MIYLLDTNAVSALMKGSVAVVERLATTKPADVAVPQPVLAEIAFGIERLPRSKRRAALQSRFDLISAELPRAEWTDVVSQMFGRIKATLERRGTRIEGRMHSLSMRRWSRRTSATWSESLGFASRTGAAELCPRSDVTGCGPAVE